MGLALYAYYFLAANPFLLLLFLCSSVIFHPLLDAGGNMTTEDKEKAEVLNAFFKFVFTSYLSLGYSAS